MKHTRVLFSALAFFAILTVVLLSVAVPDTGTVHAVLNVNSSLMEQTFNKPSSDNHTGHNEQISVSLNTEAATIEISGDIEAALEGTVDKVTCDDGSIGYVGVYDGELSDGTTIVADVVYNEDDVFAAITLGTLGGGGFNITFYGEFTEPLKAISNKNAENAAESRAKEAAANP